MLIGELWQTGGKCGRLGANVADWGQMRRKCDLRKTAAKEVCYSFCIKIL